MDFYLKIKKKKNNHKLMKIKKKIICLWPKINKFNLSNKHNKFKIIINNYKNQNHLIMMNLKN